MNYNIDFFVGVETQNVLLLELKATREGFVVGGSISAASSLKRIGLLRLSYEEPRERELGILTVLRGAMRLYITPKRMLQNWFLSCNSPRELKYVKEIWALQACNFNFNPYILSKWKNFNVFGCSRYRVMKYGRMQIERKLVLNPKELVLNKYSPYEY